MEGPGLSELDLQREVQVLRAHRRLSASQLAVIDPDFPGLASPPPPAYEDAQTSSSSASPASSAASTSASPPGTPQTDSEPFDASRFQDASPIFGSSHRNRYLARRQMRLAQTPPGTSQPLPKRSARAASGPSDELWVSASIHPEVSPSEFRTFLREQAEKNVSLHPAEVVSSQDLASRYLARSASLTRRGSSLRKQVKGDEREVPDKDTTTKETAAVDAAETTPIPPTPPSTEKVTDPAHWQRARSIPPRQVRDVPRSHRKPPPTLPPNFATAPETSSRYVAPVSPTGRARTLSAPTPPTPPPPAAAAAASPAASTPPATPPPSSMPSSPSRGTPRAMPSARVAMQDELKLTPAELRAMLPQKGELPSLPSDATGATSSALPERVRRPLPDVRQAASVRTEPERSESPRPLPRVPKESEVVSRRSEEREPRMPRTSDEPVRPPSARDRKTFGLSWFGLSKDDDDIKARRKDRERAEEEAPSTPRREKETFLTNLFGKRKGLDAYDLRHRARNLFSPSSSSSALTGPSAMETRYPLATERALYRLSHMKLSNPRRPLQQQVIISNLMFWYLSVIHSSLARPAHGASSSERRGLGPSEYDDRVRLCQPGTGPVATHTGTLLRTVPRYGSSTTVPGLYGASSQPPAWSMAPDTMQAASWQPVWNDVALAPHTQTVDDTQVQYATPAPSAKPPMSMPRTARGPLPPVPVAAGSPRSARQTHLDQHLEQVQAQALSTERALRHARSSPSLRRSVARPPPVHRSQAP